MTDRNDWAMAWNEARYLDIPEADEAEDWDEAVEPDVDAEWERAEARGEV